MSQDKGESAEEAKLQLLNNDSKLGLEQNDGKQSSVSESSSVAGSLNQTSPGTISDSLNEDDRSSGSKPSADGPLKKTSPCVKYSDSLKEPSSSNASSPPISIAGSSQRMGNEAPTRNLQTSPLGTRISIEASPVKAGLIYDFNDKLRQILFDLALVHACNLDQNFLIDPKHDPPKNLLSVLSEKMNSMYWEDLRKQLDEDPPVMGEALKLVADIKVGLHSILLPWHTRIKAEIDDVLDIELIKQQAEKGSIDFKKYATYIISLLSKLCAPARDGEVAELKKSKDIISTFRGIFGLINHMKIDMINYNLLSVKAELLRNGRKCERDKFNQWLNLSGSNLPNTRQWLAHFSPVPRSQNKKLVIHKAFLHLIRSWQGCELPEPLDFDAERLARFAEEYFSIIFIATTISVALGFIKGKVRNEVVRTSLKDNLLVLMKGVRGDPQVKRVLGNIIEQIVKQVRDTQTESPSEVIFTDDDKTSLTGLVSDINPHHPVRMIMTERVDECLINIWNSIDHPIPPSLQFLSDEINGLAKSTYTVLNHLLSVYGDLLYALINYSD